MMGAGLQKKVPWCGVWLGVGLALLPAGARAAQEAAAGDLGQPAAIRVVELWGTPFERGRRYGEELRAEIHEVVDRWKADLKRTHDMEADVVIQRFLAGTSFEVAIERWTPGLLDEVRGLAEGCGIDFETMYAFQLPDELWAVGPDLVGEHCTSIGVARRGTQPALAAQNMDVPRFYHGHPTLLKIAEEGREALVYAFPGIIALNGMNDARVAICCNTLLQLRPCRDGLPVAFVVRGVLRQPSFAKALAFLREIRHASGQNYVVGGPEQVISLECSAGAKVPFWPLPGADLTWHTNHPLASEDFSPRYLRTLKERGRSVEQGLYACGRFATLVERLGQAPEAVDAAAVRAALSSRDSEQQPICHGTTYGCTMFLLSDPPELRLAPGRPDQVPFSRFRF